MDNRFRFQLGDFSCLAINDGTIIGKADRLFVNAPEDKLQQALQQRGLQPDHLPSAWTCLLVETPAHLVLVDTGENNVGHLGGGQLFPALQAEGITPEDIDTVILTHGHGDHIGGCVNAVGQPAFPNARYLITQTEWDYWTDLQDKSERIVQLIRRCLLPLKPQLETIQPGEEILPGIRTLPAAGHTSGHIALEITSGGETLLNLADAVLHPIQLENPDWVAAFDASPEQTVATRKVLCQRAVETGARVLVFHFTPFPGLGYILKKGNSWAWQSA